MPMLRRFQFSSPSAISLQFGYLKKILNSVKTQNENICIDKIKNNLPCSNFNLKLSCTCVTFIKPICFALRGKQVFFCLHWQLLSILIQIFLSLHLLYYSLVKTNEERTNNRKHKNKICQHVSSFVPKFCETLIY